LRLATWDPAIGAIEECGNVLNVELAPHFTLYVTVSEKSLGRRAEGEAQVGVPVETVWAVSTERPNTVRLSAVEFQHEARGWLPSTDTSVLGFGVSRYPMGIPRDFHGATRIPMRGAFTCESLPGRLGILFERGHLESLLVNGRRVDLSAAEPTLVWDRSCAMVDVRDQAVLGLNTVAGVLAFERFETSLHNQTFHCEDPMPTCDVCVAGSFRCVKGVIAEAGKPLSLPLNLTEQGWEQYDGVLALHGSVLVGRELAERIKGIRADLVAEDSLEVLLDGVSLGRKITGEYRFAVGSMEAGTHRLTLRLSSTSANILGEPSPWGIRSVSWICRA
jgi:hypothetical protein